MAADSRDSEPIAGEASGTSRARLGPPFFATIAVAFLIYVCFVVLAGVRLGGVSFTTMNTMVAFAAGVVLIMIARRVAVRRAAGARLFDLGVAGLLLLVGLFVVDVVYTIVLNARQSRVMETASAEVREADRHVWHGELYPRLWIPTDRNFFLYKPDVRLSAETFGEYYQADMLRSPLLRDSVLEPRRLSYDIGSDGLRELRPLSACRTVALGDSYVFGYATDAGSIWTTRLGQMLGEPVCNLGVSSTGPRSHLQLLEYLQAQHPDSLRIERVLWMIFEGNDLENSYEVTRAPPEPRNRRRELLAGTLPELALAIPGRLRNQSVLRRLLTGELRARQGVVTAGGRAEVNGIRLLTPLYHSSRFGHKLFNPDDVLRATFPASYVLEHPHRPLLDQVFEEMKALAARHGFEVTVIVAPSDARLLGPSFEDFPPLSERAHFIDYVVDLAGRTGFRAINLLPLMEPAAREELLYYRDDHHWNVRGNELAASLIRDALMTRAAR
jgi:hypothetical protein